MKRRTEYTAAAYFERFVKSGNQNLNRLLRYQRMLRRAARKAGK